MTCIAGIVNKGKVFIGGDSAACEHYDLRIRADSKVFKTGPFLMGFTTSFRLGQLLRHCFTPPELPENIAVDDFMVKIFIEEIRKCLKNGGYSQITDNVEKGGTFLVGFKGRLFTIYGDFQVEETIDNFAAIGCGAPYAKAVLWHLRDKILPARKKLLLALKAASYFSAGVRPPFITKMV